ncbi:hypothetical protein QCA50_010310 [Cerrena zonata]|uniref:Uncharacterized protein n=1 Tax=Cerrena zonata TaxID=2478898 RepID=A0AAW0GCC4_9APHY
MAFLTSWTHKLNNNPTNPNDPTPTNNPTLPSYQPVATHYVPPPKPKIPPRPNEWPIPTLRIRVDDLNHPGAQLFFKHINPYEALKDACIASFVWLYTLETVPRHVEVIQLILRSMPGVAHTTGSDINKEIHFSLDHIVNCAARAKDEIHGVLTHEVVHCYQYNGRGSAPGGLIEGIADFVRLRASFIPPHWRPRPSEKWDAGYDSTAYFLSWLEEQHGTGLIAALNLTLRDRSYEDAMWKEHTGKKVGKLWKRYCECLEEDEKVKKVNMLGYGVPQPPPPVPTHNRPEVGEQSMGEKGEKVVVPKAVETKTSEVKNVEEVEEDMNMEGDDEASENSTDSEMVVVEHNDKGKEKEKEAS